jgi:hypothetical protein
MLCRRADQIELESLDELLADLGGGGHGNNSASRGRPIGTDAESTQTLPDPKRISTGIKHSHHSKSFSLDGIVNAIGNVSREHGDIHSQAGEYPRRRRETQYQIISMK